MFRQRLSRYLFFIPALVLMAIFAFYPTINTIYLSFFTPEGKFDPLGNYATVLGRREMVDPRGLSRGFPLGALPHNFIWIFIHLPLTIALGLILAVVLRNVRGKGIIQSSIFLGMVIPMVIGGLLLRFMFDKDIGIVNAFLSLFGVIPKSWTVHPNTALFALILGSVWLWTGFSLILYSAGLGTIPQDYYDAAKVDGASPLQIFFKITLPLLRPITVVVVVMTVMWELKIFDVVYTATRGGPGGATNVLALQMYFYAFNQFNFNYASVVATLLLFLTILVAIPMIRRSVR
ncbi:TPA: sugar ABC transporter permease [Candidatus Bipolaricaulota bacterium]|nr:sugar ABC transporter permease [Candidatus Bipolaricaulota bacterium]